MSNNVSDSSRAIESNAERITAGVLRGVGILGVLYSFAMFLASMLAAVAAGGPAGPLAEMAGASSLGKAILAMFLYGLIWIIGFAILFFIAPMLSRLFWRGLSMSDLQQAPK